MALAAIQVTIELTEINCGCCGGVYAINERYRQRAKDHGTFWNCPYCKASWGYPKGRIKELEEELDAERQRKLEVLSRLNEAEQAKAKVERKLKRVDKGVCPECNRSFTNLARHMACKHTRP